MAIQIGKRPEHDFTNPLGMLSDCHRRIERFLQILTTVAEQARDGQLNTEQREALEAGLRYFQIAAPKHTSDEEESLFPRLRASNNESVLTLLTRLEHDHSEADQLHQSVDQLGQYWLQAGQLSAEQSAQLITVLQRLSAIYQEHIGVEDRELFPVAAKLLNAIEVKAIGEEMAARRTVK